MSASRLESRDQHPSLDGRRDWRLSLPILESRPSIRLVDTAEGLGFDRGGAVEEMLAYNRHREDDKGKNRALDGGWRN
jgi:hypothetical protein